MRRPSPHRVGVLSLLLVGGILLLIGAYRSMAQSQTNLNAFPLGPGVIVDPSKDRAYVMTPHGGVKAIGALQGNRIWDSRESPKPLKDVAKPLAVVGDNLVVQVDAPPSGNELRIASISTSDGSLVGFVKKTMPSGVDPTITETSRGRFSAIAQPTGDRANVTWNFAPRVPRGVPPGAEEKLQPTEEAAGAASAPSAVPPSPTGGAFQIKVSPDRIEEATPSQTDLAVPRAVPTPGSTSGAWSPKVVKDADRVAGARGRQFYSVDGRNILSSERNVDGASTGYTLTIYDRVSKEKLGTYASRWSVLPFVVRRARPQPVEWAMIYMTPAEPRRVGAFNLTSGKEIWSEPVRDTVDRGPSPP
jgi:hypothetical protein